MPMINHVVKCHPWFYQAIITNQKRFEVRKDDRNYENGDLITLREWDPGSSKYTGRDVVCRITYVLKGYPDAIKKGYCVFSIDVIPEFLKPDTEIF